MPPYRKVKRGFPPITVDVGLETNYPVKRVPVEPVGLPVDVGDEPKSFHDSCISDEIRALIQENREAIARFDSRIIGTDYTPPAKPPTETILERMERFRKKVLTFEEGERKQEGQ